MPRNSRQNNLNDSKVYHVILKGVNKQELFFEDSDRIKFLKLLKETKEKYNYEIYAYVLMNNHVHLILFDKEDKMSQIMHRICSIYAVYFNKKYERVGHLFQNRFKNTCVNTESYLLNLQRYIHKNPQKDGIGKMESYSWSSYREYVNVPEIVNTEFILSIFSEDKNIAIARFEHYNKMMESNEEIKEFAIKKCLNDEEAIKKIKIDLKIENIMAIANLNKKLRDEKIKQIANINGISPKQISRILGINVRTIQRAISGK